MAGIGFELRKLLNKKSYSGLFQAYAYAGVISSGPWILSIIGILLIGLISISDAASQDLVTRFQVSVTYLIMSSLVLTGLIQLGFTRFIADRIFEKRLDKILPNFNGLMLLVTSVAGVLGLMVVLIFFNQQSALYRLLMLLGFVIMCAIWVATIFLSGMRQYKAVVLLFALGYAITVSLALLLRQLGTEGLLLGFVVGHAVLLLGMIVLTIRNYPSTQLVAFDFMRKDAMYVSLIWIGFAFNLAVWADKIMFWFYPDTSMQVIGPLRASLIYDLPIFLAYLSIIPGMAVFLVRIETDFAEYCSKFYDAIREGGTLDYIEQMRNKMVFTIRQGLAEIIKIQTIAVLITFVLGPTLLAQFHIPLMYLPLLYIVVVAASLQVMLLGIINIFFYLDKRRTVVILTSVLLLANIVFTSISLHLGATFYGYGFALALLVCVLLGMHLLEQKLESLEYETFMLFGGEN